MTHTAREHSGEGRLDGRSICICVDDFGLYPGINEAVLRLADAGTVHATGCMVGAPHWRAGAAALREVRGLDVGLHLDFTERPLNAAARRGLQSVILSSYFGGLDRALVRTEIKTQLDEFEAAMDHPPDFIDGHQHVHQLPVIRDELLAELQRRYRGAAPLPWIRSTRRARRAVVGLGEGFKAWFIEQIGAAALAGLARQAGCRQNAHLLGVYDFSGGTRRYEALLANWLAGALPGDLLMCHPSALADAGDPLGAARRAEFEVLNRPGLVVEMLAEGRLGLAAVKRS